MKNNIIDLLKESCKNHIIYEINLSKKTIFFHQNETKLELQKELILKDFLLLFDKDEILNFQNKLKTKNNTNSRYKLKIKNNSYLVEDNSIYFKEKEEYKIGSIKLLDEDFKINDSQESYKQLFQANKIPVLIICPKSAYILNANNAALEFYGYTLEEIKNLHIYEINTLSQEEINEEMELAKKDKRDCFNFKHKTKRGEILDVEVYSGPINYNNNTQLYSVIFDISKRKKAEYRLKQAHTIYQNTKEGIFITNLEGKILSVNKAFEIITGYKEDEIINHNVNVLKSEKHSKTFYTNMWKKLLNSGYWEGEIINRKKDGEKFPQWLTINTVYDSNEKAKNYIAVFSDFSKIKNQEKLLREKDQIMFQQSKMAAMGEMLRNIAHQWRQPLSVISSSATGLKIKKEFGLLEDNDFNEFADGILKSVKYLSETIEDFSNYFKNDKNKEVFFISNVIQKTSQLIEASLKNHNITLEVNSPKEDLRIYGVKNELIQVLLNLLNNSKDAFKQNEIENRVVKIEIQTIMNNACLFVRDNAGGIPQNIIEKIFEPYFTTKHQSQGTGIGLYMSQEIIQEHLNGSIDVYNLKEGVEFKIMIPLALKEDI